MSGDNEEFWKVKADDQAFWDAYVATRPVYSQTFYDKIFNYHQEHSSNWKVAHDIGCGAGQLTTQLVPRFEHVIASDCHDTHLAVTKRNLKSLDSSKVSFTHSKGEFITLHHPPGSADLAVCSETMPMMEETPAMSSFHNLLCSGGTLALTFYGRPTFTEPQYVHLQSVLDQVMDYSWRKAFEDASGAIPETILPVLSYIANGMASWLDYVDFDPALWTDVKRIKWNPKTATLPFFGEKVLGVPVTTVSSVKPVETVQEIEDSTWWCNNWTISDLKEYFRVLYPNFADTISDDDHYLTKWFSELESGMGGSSSIRNFTWPTVLVLATKR